MWPIKANVIKSIQALVSFLRTGAIKLVSSIPIQRLAGCWFGKYSFMTVRNSFLKFNMGPKTQGCPPPDQAILND